MKTVCLCVLVMSLFLILMPSAFSDDEVISNYDQLKMQMAIQEARSKFDEFVVRFKNPQAGDEDFFVKVRIEDEHGIEHFWVGDLNLDSEPYSGTIGNEPKTVKNVTEGQTYSFSRREISDWMYMNNGKMIGNYTSRVLLERMDPKEAEEIRLRHGW